MKGQIKRIISIVLIVAMTITNNGLMVFADSVESIVNHNVSTAQETPNYYYYEETTTVAEYQAYLESQNPAVVKDENFDDENSDGEKETYLEEPEEEIEPTTTEEQSESSEESEETESEEESKDDETETQVESSTDATTEKVVEETVEEKVEETKKDVATDSEVKESDEKIEEEVATESEILSDEKIVDEKVATESEVLSDEIFDEEKIATESEANEKVASESELEEVVATNSEAEDKKEVIIATVSKVSWKVKKVLIATFASLNVKANETEKDRLARLATYANVIIVNDKGEEKMFKVNLKWKLLKKYEVNAKSNKTEAPISKDVWRKNLKVDEYINEQEEVLVSTSNIALVEERVKEENAKLEDKEYVIKLEEETSETTVSPTVTNPIENIEVTETETQTEAKAETYVETYAETYDETYEETYTEAAETTIEETINKLIEESEESINEPTVAGFNNTDEETTTEEVTTEVETTTEATSEEITTEESVIEVETTEETEAVAVVEDGEEVVELATDSTIDVNELSVDAVYANGEEINDSSIQYFDLQSIYLYKVDVPALGEEIIELINEENNKEEIIEEQKEEEKVSEEKPKGFFESIANFFGFNLEVQDNETNTKAIESNSEEEDLMTYLQNSKVDVLLGSILDTVVAEFDEHLLGAGATHTQHQISANVNGEKLDYTNIFDSVIGGDASDMLDLSPSNKRIKATGSNIIIAGTYYLPGDIKISNQWIVEKSNTLTLCLNGHNIVFATAGCVRGQGRVVVCNCEGKSTITTEGPQYNWHDKWYASTSEAYTKWNEHSLFSGKEVGVYAKDHNIVFENSVIKNQYVGRKAVEQMEEPELDEAEYSGDGSVLWGTHELQVYGVIFSNNVATRSNGVAANAQLGKMTLEDCTFTGNKNLSNRGGAIAFNPKATIIHNCEFKNNLSFTNGGAIFGRSYTNSNETTEIGTVITKTTFEGNAANVDGGAIFMDYLCEKGVTFDGTSANKVVFKNNYAGVSGGAIAVKHMRSVDGQDTHAYSYEDATNRKRLLNINYTTFEGNAAKGITINFKTGEVKDDETSKKENFGGALYLSSETISYTTFPTDQPLKEVNINNCTFTDNFTKGHSVEIKAKDIYGEFTGDALARYNLANAGGAVYASKISSIKISDTKFSKNQSMTGANLCVKESTVSVLGGELSQGKAYNCSYSATEFYKKVISPGGGAAYIMKGSHVSISQKTKIESNENAFYLDGGSIDLGASEVKNNIGEYLIGYTNYKTNRILFSGVDIKEHEFHETRKDYASSESDATKGPRKFEKGIYAPSYVSFKDTNAISHNRRNFYTKNGNTYDRKSETANLVMTSSRSNLQFDLSKYLFDVPFTAQDISERIGLYYEFDASGPDQIVAFDKWDYRGVRVIDEGGLWTNYFEIDNSHKNEWAEGWKFYIEKNEIRMSPNIVQVKFDSYIENVPRIKPQYYNIRKQGGEKVKIATPTEIVRRDIFTPGKTLLGFLGVDKTDSTNTKYDIWDFDRCVIDPMTAETNEIIMILLYTDDTIQIKPCGCANGVACAHEGTTANHTDRGTARNEAEARYLNYIEVATYPQLSYRYDGRKTQYALSKDLKLTAAQAQEFIDGGMVLNLNGKTLTYDTTEGNDAYILNTTGTDVLNEASDAKVMICGVATPGAAERGKIVANGTHKGAFIVGDSDIYLNKLTVENVVATTDSNKAFIHSDTSAINTYINTKDVVFENVNLKSDLINAGSKVIFDNTLVSNSLLQGSVVKLQANSSVETKFEMLSSDVENMYGADALLSANLAEPRVGTKVRIATSNVINSVFESKVIKLETDVNGANSGITLQGDVSIKGNVVNSGDALIYDATTNGDDIFGLTTKDNILITDNTVPHVDSVTVAGFYGRSVTFKGNVAFTGNKTPQAGKATNKVSAVRSGNATVVSFDEVAINVKNNSTLYDWFAENNDGTTQTYDKPIFTQVPGTKLRASDSVIKIRLLDNSEYESQKIYENWSVDKIIGEKEAEATFMRDDSYAAGDPFDVYKRGKNETDSDIYLGSSFVAVVYRLYNYKAGVDERADATAGYTEAEVQRVEPDVYTLLDTPQYTFDFSRTSVMWEAFAYKNRDGSYDYSQERLYPEKTTQIAIKATKSVLISGYIYNYNNKRHVHEGNVELWTEARNEGHLQATNSFVFLHNDIEITHKLLFTPETTYHLCLNGHKLIFNTDTEWFDSITCKFIICDCQKTGSIVQEKGELVSNVINVRGGELDVSDVTFGPFSNIKDSTFMSVDKTVKTNFNDVEIKEVNMNNTALTDNAFIDIETNNIASFSNLTFNSNKMLSNHVDNAILSIKNFVGGDVNLVGLEMDSNEVNGNAASGYDGSGCIFKIEGFDNVTLESPIIKSNKSVLDAPIRITGRNTATSALNMNNVTFTDNQKNYVGTMEFSAQVAKGVSANFAATGFKRLNITGGTFRGNKFNANGAKLQDTEGGATEFVNYEANLTVKNVTFDGTGATLAGGYNGIVIVDNGDELFEDVTFKNYNIGEETFMVLEKGTGLGPSSTYIGRTTFRGNTQFVDNKAYIMVSNKNDRSSDNDNEGLVLFNGTKFDNNTTNKRQDRKGQGIIQTNGTAITIASGAIITKTAGTAINVTSEEIRLFNTEVSGGTGEDAAVYVSSLGKLTIGDKVVVKGNRTNIYIDGTAGAGHGWLQAIDGHPILSTSEINITVPDIDFNFFSEWGPAHIEKYNYHSGSTYTYLPSDLFKLDTAIARNRQIYIQGEIAAGKQQLWVSSTQAASQYATLIFFDRDIQGPKEIARQYIIIGETTKLDRVQVDYLSTLSQIWMTQSDGSKPEEENIWRLYSGGHYNEFEVKNYEPGKTYYAYLTKKHLHKICGPDSLVACGPNHADGAVHTEDLDFIQVGSNESIINEGAASGYLGLSNDLTITQAALDSLTNRDIVFCLNGYVLTFEKDATITTSYSFAFVNCEKTGYITIGGDEATSNPLISISGTGKTFSLYNIDFKDFETSAAVVRMTDVKIVSEKVSFTNIKTTAATGIYDIQKDTSARASVYVDNLSFTNNIASESSILDLRFDNFTVGKMANVQVKNNTYTNKLLSLSGTGDMDSITVENNTMIEGGGSDSYGAIYVANGANITYKNDATISLNDASINKESKGGALSVYGRLNFDGKVTLENNKAGFGGAIYVDNTGSLNVTGEAYFSKNEAEYGGAIYATNWGGIHMANAIYDNNKATIHGIVAFGGAYSGAATYRNHTRETKELIYNINEDGSDSITIDSNTLFIDNALAENIINLRSVASANIGSSYLSTGNYAKNFVEISTSSMTVNDATVVDNTFLDSVFNVIDPVNVTIASISVYENKITNAVVSVKGGEVKIGNRMTFRDNVARLGSIKELAVSGEGGYFKASERLSIGKKYVFTAYTSGIKVFEKWNATSIDNYDNPQAQDPGRYMVAPENSEIIKISDDDKAKGYAFYKVGNTSEQDIYVGIEGVDFIQLRFIDPENDGKVYASQNIQLGQETKLDKVDTLECELTRQKWLATMSDGTAKTFTFTTTQTASSSDTIFAEYSRPHLHKICGITRDETCNHMNGANHTEIEYKVVANVSEFATTTDQYIYIKSDFEVSSAITLSSSVRAICLNGHTLRVVGGASSLFDTNNELSICNCKVNGGITTGKEVQTAPIINYTGTNTLSVYKVNFYGINTNNSVINLADGAILFAGDVTFKNNVDLGDDAVIANNSGTIYLDNVTFDGNKTNNINNILDVHNGYRISTLSFINNETKSRLAWFKNTSLVNIGNLIVKNNKVDTDVVLMYLDDNTKLTVTGDASFEDNVMNLDTILSIESSVEFNVVGTISFINNTAKKHAAMDIDEDSVVTAGHFLFDGNKNTEPNNAIVQWSDTSLVFNEVEFKNHPNATDILIGNEDINGKSKIYIATPSFVNNKGIALKFDKVVDATIDGFIFDGSANNNFTNILNINNSTVSITDLTIENENLANSAVVITNSKDVEFDNLYIRDNTIAQNGSALSIGGTNTVVKIKDTIDVSNNTSDIALSGDAYLKASAMISKDSKMNFNVSGTSQKLFEGWDKSHIETYGQIASKSTPMRYTYTPENSGLFAIKPTTGYGIFKGGTGDTVSVYAGTKAAYSVLSFVYRDDDGTEEIIETQNVIKGTTAIDTLLDVVNTFEYELDNQTWYAPNSAGEHNIKWEFKDDVVSNLNSDAQIKYAIKHIHKVCGAKLYEECNHLESTYNHTTTVTYVDATSSDAAYWPSTAEYINLQNDIVFNNPIILSGVKGLCLNGHKIIIGNVSGNFMSISSELNICDCRYKKNDEAAITVKDGVTLLSSIIRVNAGGTLNAYNLRFKDISIGDYVDFTTTYNYAIENSSNGKVYLDRPVFTGMTNTGDEGLLRNQGAADRFIAVEPLFTGITLNTASPLLNLTSHFTMSTISVIENNGYAVPLIKVTDDVSVSSFILLNNTGATGQGLVSIDYGKTLTLTEDNIFEGNESQGGGVMRVAGTLIAKKDLIFKNNKTVKGTGRGGALYVDLHGKIITEGETKFIGNEAMYGSAIYSESIDEDSFEDMVEPYFEDNTALTMGVVYWTGKLKLTNATFANHNAYSKTTSKGVRTGMLVNAAAGDKLVLDGAKFINNNLVGSDDSATAIRVKGLEAGSEIIGFTNESKDNTMANFIYAENSNMLISGSMNTSETNNKFTDTILSIKNAGDVTFDDLCLEHQTVENEAVYISGAPIKLVNEIRVINNVTSAKQDAKNIVLADDNAYFKGTGVIGAPAFIKESSIMGVSVNGRDGVKIFEGWNKENIEYYDNPQVSDIQSKYMYTPENSQLFVQDVGAANQAVYKKGYAGDGDGEGNIYFGTNAHYVTLKYYNDVEEVPDYVAKEGDKEYYGYQNIAKGVPTKLDKVDSQEYEIEKQEWYVGYKSKDVYDYLEKFNPADPRPTVGGVNGVVETFNIDQEIRYHQFHIHKVCGLKLSSECKHNGHADHTATVEYNDVSSIEELEAATGYAVLIRDLDIANMQRALNLKAGLQGVCLNGHSIMGDGRHGLFNITHAFTLCNCKPDKENSGITSDESFTQAKDIININTTEEVGIYRLKINDVTFGAGYAINVVQGNVFIGYLGLVGCTKGNANGVVRSTPNIKIDTLSIDKNKVTGRNPLFKTSDTIDVEVLYVTENEMEDSIVVVDSDAHIPAILAEGNTSANKGAINVVVGRTLTIDGQLFSKNSARLGGALYVAGTFVSNAEDPYFDENKATEKGGAIYLEEGAKIQLEEVANFVFNEAEEGAAIYAEKLSTGDMVMPKSNFLANYASVGGAISFGGELVLSDVTFERAARGSAFITNINTSLATDKADISSVSIIENVGGGRGIVLTNVQYGSKIQNVIAKGNEVESLIDISNIANGNKVYLTNINEVTDNKFSTAGIVLNDVAYVALNNVVMKQNSSTGYGAIYINGETTFVDSVGELTLNDNTNTGDYGAAITIMGGATMEEDGGMVIAGNRSLTGGAIYLDGTLGVQSQSTKPLKVSTNFINDTTQTKNIFVANENSYVFATGRLSDESILGFTAGAVNVTAFKYWNSTFISKIGSTDKFVYTPENSGLFVVDTLSQNAKQEFFKSGLGSDVVVKLGANFTKLHFVTAGKQTEYLTQNIERGVETKLDKVLVNTDGEKWVAPSKTESSDYKWSFNKGDLTANYSTEEEFIYKLFTYSIEYTGGSKGGSKTYNSIEYGEAIYVDDNSFAGTGFKSWILRNASAGMKKEYMPGDLIKNICDVEGGVAYLDARWSGEIIIKFDPNGARYGLDIPYDSQYDMFAKGGEGVRVPVTYPVSLGGSTYTYYTYSLKADGTGKSYNPNGQYVFNDDVTLYLIWTEKKKGGGGSPGGSSGGSGGGTRGGSIPAGEGVIGSTTIGPGIGLEGTEPQPIVNYLGVFTVDSQGNIRDGAQNIVGNIHIGDRVNADGSFTAVNGITIYPNGAVKDTYGNIYNPDGTITTANGNTYYTNGDVKDASGTIYHTDGSTTLPDGTVRDADGIIHHPDGSITLPDGTTYFVDGTIMSPGGIEINQFGQIVPSENAGSEKETPGSWNYNPETNEWKFENINANGTKTTYTDQWICTKNAQGEATWYTVDRDGNMITGWVKSDGEYYYMSTNPNSRGELVKGTVMINGKSYTFDAETGTLTSGEAPGRELTVMGAVNNLSGVDGVWKTYPTGERYFATYFNMPDGTRLEVPPSGWFMVDGHYHYFDEYGVPKTGLVVYDEKYYYFNEDGTMKEGGEITIDNTTYVFDKATGACRTMRHN